MKLSIIIVVKNEETWLPNCLQSLQGLGDEIILVDTGSTDNTRGVAQKNHCRVLDHPWEGFATTKNFAVSHSAGEWLFFIDADERVSAKLGQEIKVAIESNTFSSYSCPRLNYLLGQEMHHGGWWPDKVTRLVKKDAFQGWEGELHEHLNFAGPLGSLSGPLFHLSHRGIAWMLTKSLSYTPIEAKLRFAAKHPPVTWWRLLKVMFQEFFTRFISLRGYQDGMVGLIESLSQSYNMFLVYVFLWERQKGKTMSEIYAQIDKNLAIYGL